MPASAAMRATAASSAAAPARTRAPSTAIFPNAAGSRITTPGIPPSRTSRFEPTPITLTRVSGERAYKKVARSSASAGRNSTSAGPLGAKPDEILERRILGIGSTHGRERHRRSGHHHAPALQLRLQSGGPMRNRPGAEHDDGLPPSSPQRGPMTRTRSSPAIDAPARYDGRARATLRHSCRGRCRRWASRLPDRPAR